MKKVITIVVVLIVLGLVAFRLINNKKDISAKSQVKTNTNLEVAVNVAPVEVRTSERNLRLVGTVAPAQEIDVKAEVAGKITSLTVDLGDEVTKGRVIARIDDRTRELSLANARQVLADAKQSLERYQRLYEGGAVTKAQLDQYTLAYKNAQINVSQARKELSNTAVVAPISGIIAGKATETGAFTTMGSPLVTIVDVSELKVTLNVAENDVYTLKTGDPVKITTAVYPGVTYTGKITFISPRGDETHNYPVEISLVNQKKNPLKAGTYVDVAFNQQSQTPSLQLPRESLVGSIQDARVYVVGPDNIARLRRITIGADNGAYLEVVKGLSAGERVVTTGHINLTDSTRVNVIAAK